MSWAPANRKSLVRAEALQEQTITWIWVSFSHASWRKVSWSSRTCLRSHLSYMLLMGRVRLFWRGTHWDMNKFSGILICLNGTKLMQCTKVMGTILILVEFKIVYQAVPAATCSFFF
jgi:hypothetical protein